MHKFLLMSVAVLGLNGCAWLSSSSISASSIDQNAAIQESNDTLLVVNILRARDRAPLHFGDIPKINETLQFSAGITPTVTFGPHTLAASNTVAPTASVQESPSFEMDNLDTQDFITGIMSPLKPKLMKYWLDRGLDPRIVMLVFVSGITLSLDADPPPRPPARHAADKPGTVAPTPKPPPKERVTILNSPHRLPLSADDRPLVTDRYGVQRTAYGIPLDRSLEFKLPFLAFLRVANWINGDFFAVAAADVHPVGPPIRLDGPSIHKLFGDIAHTDPKNYEIDAVKGAKETYQLSTVGDDPKITLCFSSSRVRVSGDAKPKPASSGAPDSDGDTTDLCGDARDIPASSTSGASSPPKTRTCGSIREWLEDGDADGPCALEPGKIHLEFTLRSTGDIIHFLGELQALQEHPPELQPNQLALNNPVTLGYCADEAAAQCGGVLFDLRRGALPGRLHVTYGDGVYTVPEATDRDHTLEVLAILTQLVNLNKSGKDLRGTPTIRLIP